MSDQRIIDTIAAHQYDDYGSHCICGDGPFPNNNDMAAHQLDALRGNRIAVLELPDDVKVSEPIGETRWHYSGEVNARSTPTTKPGVKFVALALTSYALEEIPHLIACILSAAEDLTQEDER